MSYTGKKWFCAGEEQVLDKEVWWEDKYITKPTFKMTLNYKKYLREKAEREKAEKLMMLKDKLEYQYKTYGEVDELDFREYEYLLKQT